MRILLDANVLYPTVMREVILGVAETGVFMPLWSPRILEEWARAAARLGPDAELQARSEIARLRVDWPSSSVLHHLEAEARLWLPDPADVHVLAAAIAGSADGLMTLNAKDFPKNILSEEGLYRIDPDSYLARCLLDERDRIVPIAQAILAEAQRLSGEPWTMRKLMKKARLPRFGKAVEALI